ncbi:MAG: hypothetical protein EBU84_20325, partial [Actinobacteria bacterium]|nr:hypothetical protein [Actinomycetota bacterium]
MALALVVSIVPAVINFTASPASANVIQADCAIGTSSACPAYSPQEIFNLYGTTNNTTYWLSVGGVATQVYVLMSQTNSDGGGWILMMKGVKGTTNFGYNSTT